MICYYVEGEIYLIPRSMQLNNYPSDWYLCASAYREALSDAHQKGLDGTFGKFLIFDFETGLCFEFQSPSTLFSSTSSVKQHEITDSFLESVSSEIPFDVIK